MKIGQIVKNIIASEPVVINKIVKLGTKYSVTFTGVNTNLSDNKIIDEGTIENLEILGNEGTFNFQGDPKHFKLFAEAERINSAYQFDPLFAVNCSIVDPLPHQVEAVYKFLLPQPRIRFLLADDTGAGKTIMTGLLLKELLMRSLVERILIITPGGLTKQWQEDELGLKFNISFKLVNRSVFSSDPNIFIGSNRLITSIDFLRNEDVLNIVKDTSWDLIIVDEAHKLSAFDYGDKKYVSKRYQALETLSKKCDHLLLLTATPHRGRTDTFKNLLQLLDEDIFASDSLVTSRVNEVSKTGVNKFFIRRLKEEMRGWDGKPLFKERHTKTVLYELTPPEKKLYEDVTDYLTKQKEEAQQKANVHVSLALMVMQRRLTSSIYAIMKTLKNRYFALKGLIDELNQNPNLWKQKQKFDMDFDTIDDFDEFTDEERESLEGILSDPKKFRLFTTASSPAEIQKEAEEVKALVALAENLYNSNQEEHKFTKLRELLQREGILDKKEKLVIFTEHKDTLDYLETRLKNNGYEIETIHGGKSVDERRSAQNSFARESQILIGTDAAGEGINLQFCRLLINWDIPWNPNRLEQRMGRIHRYGQKKEVLVFNMVAQNTREGNVLQKLLDKLDMIREQMGDDRVYDVISDVFDGISLDDIIKATFEGKNTSYIKAIDEKLSKENVSEKLRQQKDGLGYSTVNYQEAQRLKEDSDEKRLQPIYIKMFFENAFESIGGKFSELRKSIYKIHAMPESIIKVLKEDYNISVEVSQILFCFDKQIFLDYQNTRDLGIVHFINPGNPIFDSLVKVIRIEYKEDVLKGTMLISPDDSEGYFAFFVKSQIKDNRQHKENKNIADERLLLVCGKSKADFSLTSPAKLIDLHPPKEFAKKPELPDLIESQNVLTWSFENITEGQFEEAKNRINLDIQTRKEFIEEAFTNVILDLTQQVNELQGKILLGKEKVEEKVKKKQKQIDDLIHKRKKRIELMNLMQQLDMKEPEILGCVYVIPLTQVEYEGHYGMSRDDEVEATAMNVVFEYERKQGWTPVDVSKDNVGFDIKSISPEGIKKYIEVKGRAKTGAVMLSENEMNRLTQLGNNAWLYIVVDCKTSPKLHRIQNPGKNLNTKIISKGVQHLVPHEIWKAKVESD